MADIGIMGGTFDPIHNGHLLLGRQAYEEYALDEVWFMPSGTPPHKKNHLITEVSDRCEMVRLAVEGEQGFCLSEFEAKRPGNTYTAETLRLLHEAWPSHRFFFIIGADSLYQIEQWYHPMEVMAQATLLVAGREYPQAPCSMDEQMKHLQSRFHADVRRLHCQELDVASAWLRERVMAGQSIEAYVPKAVARYIADHRLYQNASPLSYRELYHDHNE